MFFSWLGVLVLKDINQDLRKKFCQKARKLKITIVFPWRLGENHKKSFPEIQLVLDPNLNKDREKIFTWI